MIQVPKVDLGLSVNNMAQLQNHLFCRLDGLTPTQKQEQRRATLNELNLLIPEAIPLFEATVQKAAVFTRMSIGMLTIAVEEQLWIKSAVGLSTFAVTAPLAAQRKISLQESFSRYVIDSQQPLLIENTLSNVVFAQSILAQHYGIKTYLGVPLNAANGVCIGTLEVMDWREQQLDRRDIEHLTLLACWCLRELEHHQLTKKSLDKIPEDNYQPFERSAQDLMLNLDLDSSSATSKATESRSSLTNLEAQTSSVNSTTDPIKLKLLSHLTQELRTPLTSVIGMASVLHREVYGPLTVKQREYLEIIHNSGQNLISLVDEIVNLGVLSNGDSKLHQAAIDVEMVCQQVVNSLTDIAQQKQQTLRLSIEPGNRIWSLDKEKIRQAIYYLIVSLMEMSEPGGEVETHVSRRNKILHIAVGVSHPWLGDNFAQNKPYSQAVTQALKLSQDPGEKMSQRKIAVATVGNHQILTAAALMMAIDNQQTLDSNNYKIPRDILGLLLCCHLTELHQGKVVIQGSPNSGYRYLLQFPYAQSIKQ